MSESSGSATLLPLSTTELIRRTIQIYANNWRWFLVTAAAILLPLALLEIGLGALIGGGVDEALRQGTSDSGGGASVFTLASPIFLFVMLSFFVQQVFLQGTISFMTAEAILGRTATPFTAVEHIRERYLQLAAALIVVFTIVLTVFVLLTFAFFLCGLGAGILVYLFVTLFTLLVPVMILERVSIGDGIRRTWSLSKRRFWSLFGLLVVLIILNFLISIIFQRADIIVNSVESNSNISYAGVLLNLIYQIIVSPILPIAITLMYFDTRIRLEGLGFALESADLSHVHLSDLPSPKLPARFTTGDFSNMMVLSLIIMLVLVVLVLVLGVYVSNLV